ncbi:MAG: hypothetical protein ABFQ95_01350 [Pseudomonadota bacterium]
MIVPSPGAEQEAASLLAVGNYKKALNCYKALLKQEPCDRYRDAVRDCYIGRAKHLSNKGMYREAVVLWENHSQYCTECSHVYLYINLLLVSGFESKAADIFLNNRDSMVESQILEIEEIFAALLLTGSDELVSIFPEDSILRMHLTFAQQALVAMIERNFDQLENALAAISFRSPYKQLKLILKGYLLQVSDKNSDAEPLEHVPTTSPFYQFAKVVRTALSSPIDMAKSLANLDRVGFELLSGLQGWEPGRQKYFDKLRDLAGRSEPRVSSNLIAEGLPYMDKYSAKRLFYNLLPFYTPARKTFEKLFEPLSVEEEAHIKALASIHKDDKFPPEVWQEYENALSTQPQTPILELKRALTLRHVVDLIDAEHGKDCRCPWFEKNLQLLETSLALDPEDKATYFELVRRCDLPGVEKSGKEFIDKALLVFPEDRDVLVMAIKSARQHGLFSKALQLTEKLLALDPINRFALQYMTDLNLLKAKNLILKEKWGQAETLLQDLATRVPNNLKWLVQLHQALYKYLQGDLSQLQLLVSQGDETDVIHRVKFLLEANKLQIPLAKLERKVWSIATSKLSIRDSVQLLQLIKLMEQYSTDVIWQEIIDRIKSPLKKACYHRLTSSDFATVCEFFAKIGQFNLVKNFINGQPHLKGEPIFLYYAVYNRIKGDAKNIKRSDFELLEQAMSMAEVINDRRTGILIDKLLEESPNVRIHREDSMPPMPSDFREMKEFLSGMMEEAGLDRKKQQELRKLLEKEFS